MQWDNHITQWTLKSKLANRIIALSNAGLDLLSVHGYANKSVLIKTGIDTDRFVPSTINQKKQVRQKLSIPYDCFVVGYAAHYIKIKDHITLIKALSLLCKRYKKVLLLLCGDNYNDQYYADIQELITAEAIREKVVELGSIREMEQFYTACDCMAFPSRFENFSTVILEAMSSGLPVVASKYGGNLDQIIHGENGLLADVGSPIDFANCLSIYIDNPDILNEHSFKCREIAQRKFSIEHAVRLLEIEYVKVLSG